MKTASMRRIPPLKGELGEEFIKKADNPIPKIITPQEKAIYEAFIKGI
jgi:hypothetical protein